MAESVVSKILYAAIVVALLVVAFLVIKPFLIALLAGLFMGYIFYPVYRWLERKTKRPNLSAALLSTLVVVVLLVPLLFVARPITNEAQHSYVRVLEMLAATSEQEVQCTPDQQVVCPLVQKLNSFVKQPNVRFHIDNSARAFKDMVLERVSSVLLQLPRILLNFFIMIFVLFFAFRDGNHFYRKMAELLPLPAKQRDFLLNRFSSVTFAVIYGQLIVAVVQATLAGLGYWWFGVTSPILWSVVTFFAAIIPFLGPPIVWVPAALVLLTEGVISNESGVIVRAVLLVLWGIFVVGTIDNILKPRIIGTKANVHPVLVLLGVLGGLMMFGIIGVIIGPVVLALVMAFVDIYSDYHEGKAP